MILEVWLSYISCTSNTYPEPQETRDSTPTVTWLRKTNTKRAQTCWLLSFDALLDVFDLFLDQSEVGVQFLVRPRLRVVPKVGHPRELLGVDVLTAQTTSEAEPIEPCVKVRLVVVGLLLGIECPDNNVGIGTGFAFRYLKSLPNWE